MADQPIEQQVKDVIREQLGSPEKNIIPQASLAQDLGADELDMVELCMTVEEKFGLDIPEEDWDKIKTIKDIIEYVKGKGKG